MNSHRKTKPAQPSSGSATEAPQLPFTPSEILAPASSGNVPLDELRVPIEVVDVDMARTRVAASLRAQYKLPYAERFAAAMAYARKAAIVSADPDFGTLPDEFRLVSI